MCLNKSKDEMRIKTAEKCVIYDRDAPLMSAHTSVEELWRRIHVAFLFLWQTDASVAGINCS